jgi:hypothetical protein
MCLPRFDPVYPGLPQLQGDDVAGGILVSRFAAFAQQLLAIPHEIRRPVFVSAQVAGFESGGVCGVNLRVASKAVARH